MFGLYNYYSDRLGLELKEVDCSDFSLDSLDSSPFEDFILYCFNNGYLKYEVEETSSNMAKYKLDYLDSVLDICKTYDFDTTVIHVDIDDFYEHFDDITRFFNADFSVLAFYVCYNLLRKKQGLSSATVKLYGQDFDTFISGLVYTHYLKMCGFVSIDYEISEKSLDLVNSSIFVELSKFKGFMYDYVPTFTEKLAYMKELGLVEDSIVFLYKRSKFKNLLGRNIVEDCRVAKIKKITNKAIQFELLDVRKPIIDKWIEFSGYDEDIKDLYIDFDNYLNFNNTVSNFELHLSSLGVSYMMTRDSSFMESFFITPIESVYSASLKVFEDEETISSLDLKIELYVLYLLLEYKIQFNLDLYLTSYNIGKNELDFVSGIVQSSNGFLSENLGYDCREVTS